MPKKTSARSKKVSHKKTVVRTSSRKNESFINWTHEHPLYFLVAIAVALLALLFVHKLTEIRDESDAMMDMNSRTIVNYKLAMPKVSTTPTPPQKMMNGY